MAIAPLILGLILLGLFAGGVVLFLALASTRSGGAVASEDRMMTALAHLAGYGGYIIPVGGVLLPILLMMGAEEGSTVKLAAKQALGLNVFVFLATLLLVVLWFTVVLIPVAWAVTAALGFVALVLPAVGAIQAMNGRLCVYPFIGGMVTGR